MKFTGKIKSGFGNASFWVNKIKTVFKERYGVELFLGTLNIELKKEYILDNKEKITPNEYGGDFDVLIKECELLGNKVYIVRTEKNNTKYGDHPRNIIEIVSDINFRKTYDLKDNDNIEIEIV